MRRGMGGRAGGRGGRNSLQKKRGIVRKRSRYLDEVKDKPIDINDADFVNRFVTEHGKIIPARLTGASAKQQRRIKRGVRRARQVGLSM